MQRNRWVERQRSILIIGILLIAGAGAGAWSTGRPIPVLEPAPMEALLEEAPTAADATGMPGAGTGEAKVYDAAEWDLTVTRNASVDVWIDFLTGRNHDRTRLWLERSGRYSDLIRSELRSRGMP